jgi:hypothetical protein
MDADLDTLCTVVHCTADDLLPEVPPAELEEEYYRQAALREQEALKHVSLH